MVVILHFRNKLGVKKNLKTLFPLLLIPGTDWHLMFLKLYSVARRATPYYYYYSFTIIFSEGIKLPVVICFG